MPPTSSNNAVSTLQGHRVLVGPTDIAGFTSRIASALADGGADVLLFNSSDHVFNPHVAQTANLRRLFGRGVGVASRWKNRGRLGHLVGSLLLVFLELAALLKTCTWAQTVIMVGGKGFFGAALEYRLYRALGKRVVHVFVGTASRPRYHSGYAKAVVKGGNVDRKKLRTLARRTLRQSARIRAISRHASLVIENPLCGHFHERPFINLFKLGIPLDVEALQAKPRKTDATPPRIPGKVRVLHIPSRPEIKGSDRIQAAMHELIAEGLPLEFRQLTGIPHGQVLHEISQCDFVVVELYSDAPMAGFAAEASAFGKAAITGGYGWPLFAHFLDSAEMPPVACCHPDKLAATVRGLVQDSDRRAAVGASAQAFLREQWSEKAFADRFTRLLTGEFPDSWWFSPAAVDYVHGLGLEESEVRNLTAALLDHYGKGSLGLEHVPQVRDRLEAFARGYNPSYAAPARHAADASTSR